MRFLKTVLLFLLSVFLLLSAYDTLMPPVSTLMIGRALTGQSIIRSFVPLRQMSPHLIRAVVVAEDGRFCTHQGVDWDVLKDVVEDAEDGDTSHGGSTITMQTTKNLFLWNGRTYLRKGLEIPLALGMNVVWSKHRVLENYLNMIELGNGVFGVEAASRLYFHKSAKYLGPHEAALLAATLPSPRKRNPARPSAYVQSYAANIEARAAQGVNVSCLYRK